MSAGPPSLRMRGRASARLPGNLGFVGISCAFLAVFAASATPIALYETYRRTDALTKADLALSTVAYYVAVLAALLVCGRLSDHLGRRPVSLAALAVSGVGCLVLTKVHSVAPLIAGRMLLGVACGLAVSAIAAFVVDSAPVGRRWLASAVTTAGSMVGLTIGALATAALVQYGPAPRSLGYEIAVGMLAACAVLIAAGRETVAGAPGAAASLRPQLRVPVTARPLLLVAGWIFVSTWALGGFYLALGPSVAADQLGTRSPLVATAVFASLMAPSAIGAAVSGRSTPASAQRISMTVFALAVVAILLAMRAGAVVPFLAVSMLAGAAMGAALASSVSGLLTHAAPADRAGILSAIYVISYGGAAVPSLIAGQLSRTLSLSDIALGYGALAAVACVVTLAAARDPRPIPAG